MVLALDQLDGGTGPQIGAADADDDKDLGIGTNALGSAADPAHLLCLLKGGQLQPAEEVVAGAFPLSQDLVSVENLLLRGEQVGQGQFAPYVGNVKFYHNGQLLFSIFSCFYVTSKSPKTQAHVKKSLGGNLYAKRV